MWLIYIILWYVSGLVSVYVCEFIEVKGLNENGIKIKLMLLLAVLGPIYAIVTVAMLILYLVKKIPISDGVVEWLNSKTFK